MKIKSLLAMALMAVGVNAFAQKDITSTYITNADLATNKTGWTDVTFNDPAKQANSGTAVEAYAGWGSLDVTEYSLLQKITLPAGTYRLQGSAFFRQGGGAKDNPTKSLAFMKAGEKTVALKTLGSETAKAYANSQTEAAGVLSAGMYVNTIDFTLEAETEIEVGYYGTFDEMKSWCLVSGLKLYDMSQDPTNFDYTSHVANPSFENGTAGWTVEGAWSEQNNGEPVKVGTRYVEKWQASGGLPDGKVSQVVTGLPNGKYIVTAVANQTGENTFVIANDAKVQAPNGAALVTLNTEVTDGTLTLAFSREATTSNWVAVDNFRIYCAELNIDELKKMHADLAEETKAMIAGGISLVPWLTEEIMNAINEASELSDTPSVREINEKVEKLQKAQADLEAARKDYILAHPAEGEDLSFVLNNTWTNATGNYQGEYPERYVEGGVAAGKVMYSTVSDLVPGTYEVKFIAVANVARNLDTEVYAGEEKAYIYANDAEQAITIGTDDACTPNDYVRTIQCYVGEDGVLEYGILNKVDAGQWYVAKSISLTYVNDEKPQVKPEYTESISMNYETGVLTITPSNNDMYYAINLASAGATTVEAMKANFDLLLNGYYESAEDMEDAVEWGELFKGTAELDNETLALFDVNAGDEVTFYAVGLVWDGEKAAYCTEVAEYTFTVAAATTAPVVSITEDGDEITVSSTSADAALYTLCKPMSWLDEGETPESCLQDAIENMGMMIDSEETWELYDHMGMQPAPKTFTISNYQEMYAGEEMFIIAANVGWDGEKLAVISNIAKVNFTVGVATGIKNVDSTAKKNVMFNLAGQRVNSAKGIVIMNGKKVVK